MKCPKCGKRYPLSFRTFLCSNCLIPLEIKLEFRRKLRWESVINNGLKGLWRFKALIPLPDGIDLISMNEGGTPLVRLRRLSRYAGVGELLGKFEGLNPTGSFKDRGMTVGVTVARLSDASSIIVASTGNTAASAAAYSSRAGLRCYVVLPNKGVAQGKVFQAVLHGAVLVRYGDCFDDAMKAVLSLIMKSSSVYPLNSFNPWRIEGQKTLAYEVVEDLGKVPDAVVVPVGNAGNISAIWKGFKELKEAGLINKTPRMYGVQAAGASPLVKTWLEGRSELIECQSPSTIASAIRIGKPVSWIKALKAVNESSGAFVSVTDDEIIDALRRLARIEGLGVELASASAIAGVKKLADMNLLSKDDEVVAVLTGHALKDPGMIRLIEARTLRAGSISELISLINYGG